MNNFLIMVLVHATQPKENKRKQKNKAKATAVVKRRVGGKKTKKDFHFFFIFWMSIFDSVKHDICLVLETYRVQSYHMIPMYYNFGWLFQRGSHWNTLQKNDFRNSERSKKLAPLFFFAAHDVTDTTIQTCAWVPQNDRKTFRCTHQRIFKPMRTPKDSTNNGATIPSHKKNTK